jgi:hypothetical protein
MTTQAVIANFLSVIANEVKQSFPALSIQSK